MYSKDNNHYLQIRNVEHYQNTLISNYHRTMGPNIKANDIDAMVTMTNVNPTSPSLLLNEFQKGKKPIAIIEYKHFNINEIHYYELEPNINLATMAGLPYFLVLYWLKEDEKAQKWKVLHNQFYIKSYNQKASEVLHAFKDCLKFDCEPAMTNSNEGYMSELGFHQLQYRLRGESYNDKNKSDIVNFALPLPEFLND